MGSSVLLTMTDNGIAKIILNRPEKLNALNWDLIEQLRFSLEKVSQDRETKVLIVTGAGSAFCAGADIELMVNMSPLEARDWALFVKSAFDLVAKTEVPVIAAINGPAIGGGCELALACDIRIASEKARLGQPEILIGIIPGAGGTQRLARTVGLSRAKELVMTGRTITSEEALRIGLVDQVVPDEQLNEAVTSIANGIAKRSTVAVRLAKSLINSAFETPLDIGLHNEIRGFALTFGLPEQQQAMAHFLKRNLIRGGNSSQYS